MAKKKQQQNNVAEKPKKRSLLGLLFMPFGLVLAMVSYLILSVIVSTGIEWAGMLFGWWDYGHAERTLAVELTYLGDNFTTTLLGMSAQDAGQTVIAWFKHWLVLPQDAPHGIGQKLISTRLWEQFLAQWAYYRNAFIFTLMVTGIRCLIVSLSTVLLVLVGMLAAIDGLHMRELRKVTGGVEHAGVYHHAKALVPYTIGLSPVIYLSWPNPVNPNYILLPGVGLFYLAILTSFATFKKIV